MKRSTIKTAIETAKRFVEVAKKLEKENDKVFKEKTASPISTGTYEFFQTESIANTRESAQLKRVSMDLTHILADLRLNR
jgi:hypothetical protein